ncbi:hypothetical protein F2P47_04660 [Parvibaculum sedimenti]|uniref:Ureidoglycolate hydrolase n=1 Tax=Parvibaculum sedimenti TaxID=2608632 RepID=A0A6N6VP73_9HYPH|nr:ureidoglycolate lyase [Parvibaculum sedimenti]KAB7741700.1 hypothetical protein F2P47_04660 [Parvibaculum sedimenti]
MTTKTNDTPLVIEDLKLTPITAGNFRPYGTLVEATEDGTPFGPQDAQLDLSRGIPRFYIMRLEFRERIARHLTRHRQTTQVLASVGGKAWQLVVAPPHDIDNPSAEPHLDEIMAFDIPGNVGVMLFRGTWHAGPYFDDTETSFFNLELADTNEVDHQTCKLPDHFSRAFRLIA